MTQPNRAIHRPPFDNLLEGCQVIGFDYRYLYVNSALPKQGRTNHESLLGRTMMEAFPGIERTEMFAVLQRCMHERTTAQLENEFRFPDGTTAWFELRFDPVPEGLLVLSVDITARKHAEASLQRALRALEDSESRTRSIYDHLPHAAFVWRREDERFVLDDTNAAARSLAIEDLTVLLGSPAHAFVLGVPHIVEDLSRCFGETNAVEREVDCILPGAELPRRMALTYGRVPPDMVLMHAQDVTELRRTQERLFAAQRLEAVGRLAGGIAHDFNNLLSVILTYSRFTLDQLGADDPIRADIEQVHEAGERAADLTQQLLAFSRRQVLEPRVTNLNTVLEGIESMLRRLLGEDIEIATHTADDLGNVVADTGQLEQVIMNLVVNARDAMPHGGKLTLETANVELDEAYAAHHVSVKPGRYVRLSVTDSGAGMDEQTRHRIFEPFFTTKEKSSGTGLGLSTAYGIVKQSGGNIWVYSEPGKGTTFKVYLPRVEAPLMQHPSVATPVAATGTETILLAEDEQAVRKAAERILRTAGYRVLTASNGSEALRLCQEHAASIDLLLTDVIMPQMSGRELAERVKAFRPEIKVLFTSGYTDNAIIHHGVLEPGTRFVGKPFSIHALTHKVREVLDEDLT